MVRMSINEWKTVLGNLYAEDESVEVVWLDGGDEWVLCHDCELFEDGFETETQAYQRLREIEKLVSELEK